MKIWGVHMGEKVGSSPIDDNYVAIGWHELGDLRQYAGSREQLKEALAATLPNIKKGAIPGNAGVLFRFTNTMKQGDIVVYPSKADRMVNIGRVTGDYNYVPNDEHEYPNQRPIEWLGSFPRSDFSQAALHEIGAFTTLFSIKRHGAEFLAKVGLATSADVENSTPTNTESDSDDDIETTDDEVAIESSISQAAQATEDFIIKRLCTKLDCYEFEHFVAHILECMGYKTRVSPKSGDGGVDVIAHKDELGFEPPIIKVQCKQSTSTHGEPEMNQLLGALGDGEYGLFVNLGAYTQRAIILERNKPKQRLIDGTGLVRLILEHYHKLSPRYRTLLPLKQIYVADLA